MRTVECPHEQDVLDAVVRSAWPDRADEDLRVHATTCAICQDVLAVTGPLIEASEQAATDIRVPPSALVWWRAQVRARREAERQAASPLRVAQASAVVVAAALLLSLTGAWIPWVRDSVGRFATLVADTVSLVDVGELGQMGSRFLSQSPSVLLLALALWLILAPVAIYLVVVED